MAKLTIDRGTTSNILRVFLQDTESASGAGKTGLTEASSGLIISTIANNESSATTYTSAASNVETITTLGTYAVPTAGKVRFKQVDATNFPGVYEIQIADARFAVASSKTLLVSIQATGIAPVLAEIQLDLSDQLLSRNVSNVEGTMGEHTLGTIVLAMLESAITGTGNPATLTIYRTNGTTTHVSKNVNTTAASTANVITSVY